MLDLDDLRQHIRSANYPRGTPEQVALWQEDLDSSRANLAIEGLDLDAEDEALFAIMLQEGLSPAAMVEVIQGLYRKPAETLMPTRMGRYGLPNLAPVSPDGFKRLLKPVRDIRAASAF